MRGASENITWALDPPIAVACVRIMHSWASRRPIGDTRVLSGYTQLRVGLFLSAT